MTQECKYCGPNCQRGAGHNARVEAGDVYMAQEKKIIPERHRDEHREMSICALRDNAEHYKNRCLKLFEELGAAESTVATQADEIKRLKESLK